VQTHHDLIRLISQGDRQAFKEFYENFKSIVFNTAISFVQNPEEAEEITQDVFVEVHESASNFKQESSASTWVYRITVNKSLDFLRHRKRKKRFAFLTSIFQKESGELTIDFPDFHHPGVALENKEKAAILFKAIGQLPENQKTAFVLSQVEQLPQKEIAEVMKASEKAIESLVQRAKVNLKKELEKFYPERRKSTS
jgi:RNA polymerase sigma factor (sigma-70 family)